MNPYFVIERKEYSPYESCMICDAHKNLVSVYNILNGNLYTLYEVYCDDCYDLILEDEQNKSDLEQMEEIL